MSGSSLAGRALTPGPSPASGRGERVNSSSELLWPHLTCTPLPLAGEGPGVRAPAVDSRAHAENPLTRTSRALEQRYDQMLREHGPALRRVAATYEADPARREDLFQ